MRPQNHRISTRSQLVSRVFLMVLSVLAVNAWAEGELGYRFTPLEPLQAAPDFSLQDMDEETHTLSDYRGKVVLVNFWATWCPPCREEMPALDQLHTAYSDDGLVVQSWDALQPGLKQAIQADMSSAFFMYGVLVILVAFSVMNTQLMSVLERTHEFGVVMSLGLTPGRLGRLVILEDPDGVR